MLEGQNGVCAICSLRETRKLRGKITALSVDHNHRTKKIRGLLCHKCNLALGFLSVDKHGDKLLQSAINYVKNKD